MKKYTITQYIGVGCGQHEETFKADNDEEALEIYCRIIIEKGYKGLYRNVDEVPEEDEESGEYIYVDGTMSGAEFPVYLPCYDICISSK